MCHDCNIRKPEYNYGRALYEYRSVKDSIHRFKNVSRIEYGRYYGRKMAELLAKEIEQMRAEAIVPVPLHKDKYTYRGYNQAEVLAREISEYHNIPLVNDLIIRVEKSEDQKQLDAFQRQNNLKKAFHITQNDVKLKDIIVVDDVYTTGSTINTISSLLKEHGAENVYFLTLAIGKGM
jgi:ComF family protein